MHPALIRYATPPRPPLFRLFVVGAVAGLAGLWGGLALVDTLAASTPWTHASTVTAPSEARVPVEPRGCAGAAEDIRSER